MPDDLPGYDAWKTRLPPEPLDPEDEDCTCTTERRDRWCPTHGQDPDQAYEELRERQRESWIFEYDEWRNEPEEPTKEDNE